MASLPELSARRTAVVPLLFCQPATVPFSVTKMNASPMNAFDAKLLNTCPVGFEGGIAPFAGGIVTSSRSVPASSYTCDVPFSADETQPGPAGLNARPQAFLRCGSVALATPA